MEIKDTGIGIPKENMVKLFTPFFTTKPIGKGTGLGLAIVKQIVEQYGGNISAKSELGKGTTITIELPIDLPSNDSVYNEQ
jgi:two-component system NtrC family sensor kinase